jgi:hypothetical protein
VEEWGDAAAWIDARVGLHDLSQSISYKALGEASATAYPSDRFSIESVISRREEMPMQRNTSLIAAQVALNSFGIQQAPWVMEQFKSAGFQVGPLIGVSFSIAGPVERFEEFFQVRAERSGPQPFASDELSLSSLNPTLRQQITNVLFTRPPDFGPRGSF